MDESTANWTLVKKYEHFGCVMKRFYTVKEYLIAFDCKNSPGQINSYNFKTEKCQVLFLYQVS
jgi:hypothetical protein